MAMPMTPWVSSTPAAFFPATTPPGRSATARFVRADAVVLESTACGIATPE